MNWIDITPELLDTLPDDEQFLVLEEDELGQRLHLAFYGKRHYSEGKVFFDPKLITDEGGIDDDVIPNVTKLVRIELP